jgi:hypothetical protein
MEYEENSIQKQITEGQQEKQKEFEENIIDSTFKSQMKSTIICHHCKNVIHFIFHFSRFQSN